MNRVYVVSQNIQNTKNFIGIKEQFRFFYNKNNPNTSLPTWFSHNLKSTQTESPESTIAYIKDELKVDFFLRLVYD